jgi:hypothetical protein
LPQIAGSASAQELELSIAATARNSACASAATLRGRRLLRGPPLCRAACCSSRLHGGPRARQSRPDGYPAGTHCRGGSSHNRGARSNMTVSVSI